MIRQGKKATSQLQLINRITIFSGNHRKGGIMRRKEININADAEYISEKELMANDRGREAGKDNLPPAHAVEPCECEKQINTDFHVNNIP
jgi:hypothetical protein